jgi:hypothetical protein
MGTIIIRAEYDEAPNEVDLTNGLLKFGLYDVDFEYEDGE